jgi:hypothetical protein
MEEERWKRELIWEFNDGSVDWDDDESDDVVAGDST